MLLFCVRHSHCGLFLHLRALCLGIEDGIDKLGLTFQPLQSVFGRLLLGLFLGIACALLAFHTLQHHLETENRVALIILLLLQHPELHAYTVLLRPLQQLRLEIHLLESHLVEIDILAKYPLLEELQTRIVATVEIDGSDKGFESISLHITVVGSAMTRREQQTAQSHLVGEFAKRVARYQFGARVRQEPLTLTLVMTIDDIAHRSIEYGVTQELQPFVVKRLAFVVALADALVHQRHLVILDVAGIESQYRVKSRKKLLLLAEREFDSVNNILKPHTF